MAPRLASLKPALSILRPRLEPKVDRHGHSREADPWRGWYNLAAWKRLRWDTLVRDTFTCVMCDLIEPDTSKLVADHIIPHRGDPVLFWNPDNLQTLCDVCHSSLKQSIEKAAHW